MDLLSKFSVRNIKQFVQSPVFVYTGGSLFNTFVQIIANFIILASIPPEYMGIWNSFILFQTYALFLQAGVINGLNRELPYELGKDNDNNAINYTETTQAFTIFSIIGVIVIGIILLLVAGHDYITKITILAVILVTSTKYYENYLNSTFRSNQSFIKLGKVFYVRGIVGIITIPIVIYFGYEGYIIRFLLLSFLITFLMHSIRPFKVKIKFYFDIFKSLMKIGLPIFILAYIFQVARTSDRFWLLHFENTTMVGYYSFGLMVFSAFSQLPLTLANYIYPRMSFAHGQKKDLRSLWKYAFKVNISMFAIFMPIAIIGYFITPFVVKNFFSKYSPGIQATQILIFATVFMAASIGNNLLWSLKAWKYMIILQIGGGLIVFILPYLFIKIKLFPALTAVSLGVLSAQVLYCLLSNVLTYNYTKRNSLYE